MTTNIKLLTTAQAAEMIGFSCATLETWRTHGKGPAYLKLGYAVRYKESDLLAWVEGKTCSSTSEYETGSQGRYPRHKTASA